MEKINIDELRLVLQNNTNGEDVVIDIRNEDEYELAAIPGSINIPVENLADNMEALSKYENIYVYCNTDARSGDACNTLRATGLSNNIVCVEGGLSAWMAGEHGVDEKRVLPILQQVHLAASILVLIPALLTLFVNTNFAWIIVLPGLGLLISGVSGFCGMTRILQKCPGIEDRLIVKIKR